MKPQTVVRKQVERAELARDACRLKRAGLTYRQIGERIGCSHGLRVRFPSPSLRFEYSLPMGR